MNKFLGINSAPNVIIFSEFKSNFYKILKLLTYLKVGVDGSNSALIFL